MKGLYFYKNEKDPEKVSFNFLKKLYSKPKLNVCATASEFVNEDHHTASKYDISKVLTFAMRLLPLDELGVLDEIIKQLKTEQNTRFFYRHNCCTFVQQKLGYD